MIDCRSPKYRRKGELDGPFDWSLILDVFCYLVIVLALGYGIFMLGRHYETVAQRDTVNPAAIWAEYAASVVRGH